MYDLVLLHAPSIYDFRKKKLNLGVISDVVPSTPIFEMYPIGYVSIVSTLVKQGYSVRLLNLAVRMLLDKKYDVSKAIKSIDSILYGIDLHWLPSVQGTINIAKIIKQYHPNRHLVFGGLSATYYAKEIMQKYPYIDFVLKGDTTEPYFSKLIDTIEKNGDYSKIPNLVWRKESKIIENPFESPEGHINEVFLDYKTFAKNSLLNLKIEETIPYKTWLNAPSGMTFIQKGCRYNCIFCGGSAFAYRNFYCRKHMSLRDPAKILEEIKLMKEYLGSPIFIAGDVHDAGHKFEDELLQGIKKEKIDVPILFEIFKPASEDFFKNVSKNINEYALEISPESSNENIRAITGKAYTNSSLESTISLALKYGAKKMDVFFSIGLPRQDKQAVEHDINYAKKLKEKFGTKLYIFSSPLAPFIDPGSLAFEKAKYYGYKLYARTLEEHYAIFNENNSWNKLFNYETKWLTREDIAIYSLEAALNFLNYKVNKELREKLEDQITAFSNNKEQNINSLIKPVAYKKDELQWYSKNYAKSLPSIALLIYLKFKSMQIEHKHKNM
ncbi:MAG: TIGR04190 family B12-binding domain/radical SAM domain protein [Candidatus Micrarchaeaceae archaeon]